MSLDYTSGCRSLKTHWEIIIYVLSPYNQMTFPNKLFLLTSHVFFNIPRDLYSSLIWIFLIPRLNFFWKSLKFSKILWKAYLIRARRMHDRDCSLLTLRGPQEMSDSLDCARLFWFWLSSEVRLHRLGTHKPYTGLRSHQILAMLLWSQGTCIVGQAALTLRFLLFA